MKYPKPIPFIPHGSVAFFKLGSWLKRDGRPRMCGPLASTQLFFRLVRKVWLITSCRKGGNHYKAKGQHGWNYPGARARGRGGSSVQMTWLPAWSTSPALWPCRATGCASLCCASSSVVSVISNSCLHFLDLDLGLASGPVVGSEWWYLPE